MGKSEFFYSDYVSNESEQRTPFVHNYQNTIYKAYKIHQNQENSRLEPPIRKLNQLWRPVTEGKPSH